mmetsp:Transcript_113042/g.319854  ORF Transcript_113042/g.319854 Transcript_113042/m.319854 type:complete len:260 (-) Transcript_113042:76-855(-)
MGCGIRRAARRCELGSPNEGKAIAIAARVDRVRPREEQKSFGPNDALGPGGRARLAGNSQVGCASVHPRLGGLGDNRCPRGVGEDAGRHVAANPGASRKGRTKSETSCTSFDVRALPIVHKLRDFNSFNSRFIARWARRFAAFVEVFLRIQRYADAVSGGYWPPRRAAFDQRHGAAHIVARVACSSSRVQLRADAALRADAGDHAQMPDALSRLTDADCHERLPHAVNAFFRGNLRGEDQGLKREKVFKGLMIQVSAQF